MKILESCTPVASFGNLDVYDVPEDGIVASCVALRRDNGCAIKTIAATDAGAGDQRFRVLYVFGRPGSSRFTALSVRPAVQDAFVSITGALHEASVYERKIMMMFGLRPKHHPNPRTLILHENWPEGLFPLRKEFAWNTRPGCASTAFRFHTIEGEGIYEIPVGPVHAGIIEPGHFRFSVAGEEIIMLESRLGYTHKGTEKLFETLPLEQQVRLAERVSGDTSFSHSLAFCQAVESLAGMAVPERALYLRVIYSELERLANHLGDIGAIMTDTGFNFGGSNGSRLREIVMQWNQRLTASRFLRGVNVPGGVRTDLPAGITDAFSGMLDSLAQDFSDVMEVAESRSSLLNRLKGTGVLDRRIAQDHGVVGVAAKACGIPSDARVDYPYAAYDRCTVELVLEQGGDVEARFKVRVKEVYASIDIIRQALKGMPGGAIRDSRAPALKHDSLAIGLTEGWRGDIVYLVATGADGAIVRVDVRDPSFLNWTVLGHAAKGNVVPDFPLINKSFNLSYSGNDL